MFIHLSVQFYPLITGPSKQRWCATIQQGFGEVYWIGAFNRCQCHLVSSSGWHFFQHHHHRPCSQSPPLTWNITQNQRKGRTIEIQTMLERADLGRRHPATQTTTSHLYPDMSWKGLWRLEVQNGQPNLGLLGSLLERSNNFQQPSHVCERQQKLFWKEGDLHFAARCIISLSLSNLHCFMSSDCFVLTSHGKIDPLLPSTGLTKMTPKKCLGWLDHQTLFLTLYKVSDNVYVYENEYIYIYIYIYINFVAKSFGLSTSTRQNYGTQPTVQQLL